MLPPNLSQLKVTLEVKGYNKRTRGEDVILAELNELDNSPEVREAVNEAICNRRMEKTAVFSGPAGSCPCCGKPV